MEKIILFIKTYKNDFIVFKKLLASIIKHNKDNLPLVVSVNDDDFDFFDREFRDRNFQLIKDSQIDPCTLENKWVYQQIIKSQVHRLNICENYVCIDSDSYFIRDFYFHDFMYSDEIPYTVIHEQKELFGWSSNNIKEIGFNPKNEFLNDRRYIMDKLERKGKIYDFGPSPVIWSTKVWRSFEENYLEKNNLTFQSCFKKRPSEFTWYGEWLLKNTVIPIYPAEPLFKVFHYEKQYNDFLKQKFTLESLEENYLGIVLQSNWNKNKEKKRFRFFR
ncbi:MAG: DUF6492 family protein [Candidatus Chryseobacterium colombiense]|nr:DUF6492 family protein [Chryseobacterium sp.]WEK68453.1 MAG: DUF6492 family protein [Chryseobacterium sp.]